MREFGSFSVGEVARIEVSLPDDAIERFAEISGDFAPLHMDENFARDAGFEGRLVHGAHLSAFVSRFVGMTLPGPGALLERMDIAFRAPCYAPADIIIEGKVRQLSEAVSSLVLDVTVSLADGKILATGKTWHKIHATGGK